MEHTLTALDIYWITRLDGLKTAAFVMGVLMTACAFALLMEELWRSAFAAFGLTCLSFVASVFTPTTNEAFAMIVVPRIINDEDVRGLGDDALNAARAWLREVADEKTNTEETR